MIRKTVVLQCSPERAFSLFTEQAGQWWPTERRHTEDAASAIRIEESGRFFERASDGTEVELGVVRRFEPASRLVLDWYPGTGRANATKVEVRFEAVDGGTRVTVDHDSGAASREMFTRNAPAYVRSWDMVLAALASQA
jgi:uncharacterized protein YndB with AHSA1/START domain